MLTDKVIIIISLNVSLRKLLVVLYTIHLHNKVKLYKYEIFWIGKIIVVNYII